MNSHQRGQALPLGIALILFGVLGGLVLFNTGQMATDKARLANAADSAAYSGVLWQARALNYQAYTNRAMVANQVSIGQAVSIQSWTRYALITSENIALVTSWIPILNSITEGLENAARTLDQFLVPIGEAMVTVVDGVNQGLSASQDAIFASSFAATPDLVRTVANASDERFTADTGYTVSGLVRNMEDWSSFTDQYSPADIEDREAVRDRTRLIGRSTDNFTATRNWKLFSPRLYTSPLTRHQVNRRGETRLIEAEGPNGELQYEWKAKDTLQLQNEFLLLIDSYTVDIPVGWAEALVNESGDDTIESGAGCRELNFGFLRHGTTVCGTQWFADNRAAETAADLGVAFGNRESLIKNGGYSGIQAFRSLSDATLNRRDPKLLLRVEVSMQADDIHDSSRSISAERFEAPVVAPGELLSSVSIAEVYYQRPDEITDDFQSRNRPIEYANGYNPYWDIRLSAIPERERLLALAMRPDGMSASVPDGLEVVEAGAELGSYDEDVPITDLSASSEQSADSGIRNFAETQGVVEFDSLRAEAEVHANSRFDQLDSMLSHLDIDVPSVNDITGTIESRLQDELEDSVSRILEGIVGSSGGRNVQATLDALQADADALRGLVPEELDSLEEFAESEIFQGAMAESERLKELNQEVAARFGPIAQLAVDAADAQKAPLLAQLADPSGSDEEKNEIRRQLREINRLLVNDLANKLVETMTELNVEWNVGYRQTRHIVRELLNEQYRDPETGQIGWQLPPEEAEPAPVEQDAEEEQE